MGGGCCRLVDQGEGEVGAMPELGAVPEEEEEEGNAAAALEVDAQTSFTARTKQVLGHLKVGFAPHHFASDN